MTLPTYIKYLEAADSLLLSPRSDEPTRDATNRAIKLMAQARFSSRQIEEVLETYGVSVHNTTIAKIVREMPAELPL